MADRIDLRQGDFPWQPHGADPPLVLHKYDMPLAGIIQQHGTSFFFWCIKGEVTQGTLWGYAAIADQEREEIQNEPRDQALRRILSQRRPYTVAFSVEGRGITKWQDLEPRRPGSALTPEVTEFLALSENELELLETV